MQSGAKIRRNHFIRGREFAYAARSEANKQRKIKKARKCKYSANDELLFLSGIVVTMKLINEQEFYSADKYMSDLMVCRILNKIEKIMDEHNYSKDTLQSRIKTIIYMNCKNPPQDICDLQALIDYLKKRKKQSGLDNTAPKATEEKSIRAKTIQKPATPQLASLSKSRLPSLDANRQYLESVAKRQATTKEAVKLREEERKIITKSNALRQKRSLEIILTTKQPTAKKARLDSPSSPVFFQADMSKTKSDMKNDSVQNNQSDENNQSSLTTPAHYQPRLFTHQGVIMTEKQHEIFLSNEKQLVDMIVDNYKMVTKSNS